MLKQDVDFRPLLVWRRRQDQRRVAFGGYAIDSKDHNYRDFQGVDVKGKAVIVMRRVPASRDEAERRLSPVQWRRPRRAGDLQTKLQQRGRRRGQCDSSS